MSGTGFDRRSPSQSSAFDGVRVRGRRRLGCLFSVCFLAVVMLPPSVTTAMSAEQKPEAGFRDCSEMVVIPAGHFQMGSTDDDTHRDLRLIPPPSSGLATVLGISDRAIAKSSMAYEHPQHEVTIPEGFALSKYLITRGQFAAFVKDTKHITGGCYINGTLRPSISNNSWSKPGFEQSDRDPVVCVTWLDAKAYIA